MRVALVHDWLNGMRGGEKVLELICGMYPDADLYTLFYEREKVSERIRSMNVIESPLGRLVPGARKNYRHFLPVMPMFVERLPVQGYDLVISTSHCVAKGVMTDPSKTSHISYCFTPMRYVWEKYDDYFGGKRNVASLVMPLLRKRLQTWDVESSTRVSHFITTSEYVRDRIRRNYDREAMVIPAPCDCAWFERTVRGPSDYFLIVSALVPYKRVDLAVKAFNCLGIPLRVAGTGPEMERLRSIAQPNVQMLGWVSDEDLLKLYAGARALIFPSDEDFGIVPLEASASGCPVIAHGHGGALETVVPGVTGVFFSEQTVDSLVSAVREFDDSKFSPEVLRKHARKFDNEVFVSRFREAIRELT